MIYYNYKSTIGQGNNPAFYPSDEKQEDGTWKKAEKGIKVLEGKFVGSYIKKNKGVSSKTGKSFENETINLYFEGHEQDFCIGGFYFNTSTYFFLNNLAMIDQDELIILECTTSEGRDGTTYPNIRIEQHGQDVRPGKLTWEDFPKAKLLKAATSRAKAMYDDEECIIFWTKFLKNDIRAVEGKKTREPVKKEPIKEEEPKEVKASSKKNDITKVARREVPAGGDDDLPF